MTLAATAGATGGSEPDSARMPVQQTPSHWHWHWQSLEVSHCMGFVVRVSGFVSDSRTRKPDRARAAIIMMVAGSSHESGESETDPLASQARARPAFKFILTR